MSEIPANDNRDQEPYMPDSLKAVVVDHQGNIVEEPDLFERRFSKLVQDNYRNEALSRVRSLIDGYVQQQQSFRDTLQTVDRELLLMQGRKLPPAESILESFKKRQTGELPPLNSDEDIKQFADQVRELLNEIAPKKSPSPQHPAPAAPSKQSTPKQSISRHQREINEHRKRGLLP